MGSRHVFGTVGRDRGRGTGGSSFGAVAQMEVSWRRMWMRVVCVATLLSAVACLCEGDRSVQLRQSAAWELAGYADNGSVEVEGELEVALSAPEGEWEVEVAVWCERVASRDYWEGEGGSQGSNDDEDTGGNEDGRVEVLIDEPLRTESGVSSTPVTLTFTLLAVEWPTYDWPGEADSASDWRCTVITQWSSSECDATDEEITAASLLLPLPLFPCLCDDQNEGHNCEPYLTFSPDVWQAEATPTSDPLPHVVSGWTSVGDQWLTWLTVSLVNTGEVSGSCSLSITCASAGVSFLHEPSAEDSTEGSLVVDMLPHVSQDVTICIYVPLGQERAGVCGVSASLSSDPCWSDLGKSVAESIRLADPPDPSCSTGTAQPFLIVSAAAYAEALPENPLDALPDPFSLLAGDWIPSSEATASLSGLYHAEVEFTVVNGGSAAGLFLASVSLPSSSPVWVLGSLEKECSLPEGSSCVVTFTLATNTVFEVQESITLAAVASIAMFPDDLSSPSHCWTTIGKEYAQEMVVNLPSALASLHGTGGSDLASEPFLLAPREEWEAAGGEWKLLLLHLPHAVAQNPFGVYVTEWKAEEGAGGETARLTASIAAVVVNAGSGQADSARYGVECSVASDSGEVSGVFVQDATEEAGEWLVTVPPAASVSLAFALSFDVKDVEKEDVEVEAVCYVVVDMRGPDVSAYGKAGWDTVTLSATLAVREETESETKQASTSSQSSSSSDKKTSKRNASPSSVSEGGGGWASAWEPLLIIVSCVAACVVGIIGAAALLIFARYKRRLRLPRRRRQTRLNESTLEEFLTAHRDGGGEEADGEYYEEEMVEIGLCACGQDAKRVCDPCGQLFCNGPCWEWVHSAPEIASHVPSPLPDVEETFTVPQSWPGIRSAWASMARLLGGEEEEDDDDEGSEFEFSATRTERKISGAYAEHLSPLYEGSDRARRPTTSEMSVGAIEDFFDSL